MYTPHSFIQAALPDSIVPGLPFPDGYCAISSGATGLPAGSIVGVRCTICVRGTLTLTACPMFRLVLFESDPGIFPSAGNITGAGLLSGLVGSSEDMSNVTTQLGVSILSDECCPFSLSSTPFAQVCAGSSFRQIYAAQGHLILDNVTSESNRALCALVIISPQSGIDVASLVLQFFTGCD